MTIITQDFVFAQGHELKTDSLKVAKAFGKRHHHVVRDVRDLVQKLPLKEAETMFGLCSYVDGNKRSRPMYEMTKDGFMLLVMGYNTAEALQIKLSYINAFNTMAKSIAELNDDLIGKLVKALEAEKQSFAIASLSGRLLQKRKQEKRENHQSIAFLKSELQPLLTNFETLTPA